MQDDMARDRLGDNGNYNPPKSYKIFYVYIKDHEGCTCLKYFLTRSTNKFDAIRKVVNELNRKRPEDKFKVNEFDSKEINDELFTDNDNYLNDIFTIK